MIRGQRFELNLDEDHDETSPASRLPGSFVGDVLERKPTVSRPPTAPTRRPNAGFPEHKKRNFESKFKQQKSNTLVSKDVPSKTTNAVPPAHRAASHSDSPLSWADEERIRVDQENNQRIADMSPAQIAEERRELMDSLSPSFLQKLLLRANINSGSEEQDLDKAFGDEPDARPAAKPARPAKSVTFAVNEAVPPEIEPPSSTNQAIAATHSSAAPPEASGDESLDEPEPAVEANDLPPADSIHFPHPTQPPSLDPASSTFLEDLHSKYFPSLPADPAKLSWMQPATAAESSAYAADAPALAAASIRFDFTGALIPPRLAAEIPVSAGLHHHAEAPAAAGYTVAELAHLARSTVPAQRCIAFQTLGRILFRLGRGEFGNPSAENIVVQPGDENESDEGPDPAAFSELAQGLWREVERCQVVPNLIEESEGRGVDGGKHVSAKAYATEAVWLWRKGGGRRWKAY